MVIRRTNPFLFEKVLTPPVTLDLGAASLYTIFQFANLYHKQSTTIQRFFKIGPKIQSMFLKFSFFSDLVNVNQTQFFVSPSQCFQKFQKGEKQGGGI